MEGPWRNDNGYVRNPFIAKEYQYMYILIEQTALQDWMRMQWRVQQQSGHSDTQLGQLVYFIFKYYEYMQMSDIFS